MNQTLSMFAMHQVGYFSNYEYDPVPVDVVCDLQCFITVCSAK